MDRYVPGPDELLAIVDYNTGRLLWPPRGDVMVHAEYPPTDSTAKTAWHATLGGRKFIAAVLALVAEHHALFERLITGGDYKVLVLGTVGAYIAGNVAQKRVAP